MVKRVMAIACVAVLSITVSGCGNDSPLPVGEGQGEGAVQVNEGGSLHPRALYWEPLIRSESYTGQIAVMFREEAGVRFGGGPFRSTRNTDLSALNQLFAQHPEVTIQLGLPNITQDELDQRVQEIRTEEGYPMTDWASFYTLHVMDADESLEILSALYQMDNVWFAHPMPRAYPAGIKIPTINPGPGQDYLKDLQSTGGLSVKAAWDQGLDGTGIGLIDYEGNWNINHLDLPLTNDSFVYKYTGTDKIILDQINSNEDIQHGTAVAGVVAGKDDGVGITGIAPKSIFRLSQASGGLSSLLKETIGKNQAKYADGLSDSFGLKPGDVVLLEQQLPVFKESQPDCANNGQTPSSGCAPMEALYGIHMAIKDIVNYAGMVVVEAAGNGGVNLDTVGKVYDGSEANVIDLSKDSTGALMVGASMGGSTLMNGKHTLEKAPFSNCGSRVDVFAWGRGVVTTGYGDHPISVKNDPNQWYTADFGGTSSATALIAGSAALLQQYTRQLYTDPKSVCAIKSWEYVYLSSQQMREVMLASGTEAKAYVPDPDLWGGYKDPNPISGGIVGPGCGIGKQPDLAKAMQLIKDGCCAVPDCGGIKPTVNKKDVAMYCPEGTLQNPTPPQAAWCPDKDPIQPAIGKMMDLDGDGRADLISFSRDRKWYIDLSGSGATLPVPPSGKAKDNFGQWDMVFDLSGDTTIAKDAMLFPVVMDYNTDGKADLGLYDSISGKWVVHFTTGKTLLTTNAVKGVNPWPGWDMILDYSTQPHWQPYSRPVPGDYDGQDKFIYTFDHYMDLALQTPDGWWLIDKGGQNPKANYGAFDTSVEFVKQGVLTFSTFDEKTLKYVDGTITDTPAWAYLPVVYLSVYGNFGTDLEATATTNIYTKVPDTVGDPIVTNKMVGWDEDEKKFINYQKTAYSDNASIYTQGKFQTKSFADIGIKEQCNQKGFWSVATDQSAWDDIIYIDPYIDFGDIHCRPIPGDYDGDGYDDRAVQCGNTWKIAYTGSKFPINLDIKQQATDCSGKTVNASQTFRIITQATSPKDPLPGYVYPGGVTFKETKEIFKTVDYLCPMVGPNGNKPPCSLLAMQPAPISPYFPQCVENVKKQYKTNPCVTPNKKVACEEMHIQQAQCVWDY